MTGDGSTFEKLDELMSKADTDYERVRLDAKWHALHSLCECIKAGKSDDSIKKLAIGLATQIYDL